MFRKRTLSCCFLLFIMANVLAVTAASAGVTNPDISVIGQIITQQTNDADLENSGRTKIGMGETEIQCDAYLNPYSKGTFVFAICPIHGLQTEEAYLSIFKGLSDGVGIKAGKSRVNFGKINPAHPHTLPFIESPRVLAAMLPGDEGFNETGGEVSYLFPFPGSWASTLSGGVINGSSFHPDESKAADGWVGRWSNSVLIGDITPLEIGMSAAQGINNVQWDTKTEILGADIKTKIPFSSAALTVLTLQGEYFANNSDIVVDTTTGSFNRAARSGFYAFADLKFWQRCNGGVLYEQYNPAENKNLTNRTVKGFVGYALLEETTLFRLTYEEFIPEGSPVVHTCMFQVLFSMGPHKAHQY